MGQSTPPSHQIPFPWTNMASADRREPGYPPEWSDDRLLDLVTQIKDWQINHGSLLKVVDSETEYTAPSQPVGCFPSSFPRARFREALDLQKIYNKLYCSVAEDEEWIHTAIQDLLPVEPLAAALWEIHQETKRAGYVQKMSAGIFRSDYMLHAPDTLKQVEFNSFSCSGGAHANKAAEMHRYLAATGMYDVGDAVFDVDSLPVNRNIQALAASLAQAHAAYGSPKSRLARQTAVLFVVQPYNFNIADERPLEYALWNQSSPVPAYRLDWGSDALQYTRLTESRQLLFHPPWIASRTPMEISVVYHRAGYEAHEYDVAGRELRLRFEKSMAIKCPSVLGHLTTLKKVQQALTLPGQLQRFLPEAEATAIRDTFVPVYPLDESAGGQHARRLAHDQPANHILKPSLEGGGHNVYGDAIPEFLASIPPAQWSGYILMERIHPPASSNLLMGPAGD
ncbi:hypothetical protein N7492_009859 [Penicillium capsulatum]|uniref:Glutathione synthetase n=1 Tax=Penicillium capsulatum TaxID=69766 RepID=A0A9W9HMC4_9EURO|nr:hypothetical protein N7492_009859 [Penicillium capsulatum]